MIFVAILGEGTFYQSQNYQWTFYAFLGLDYLISARKILNIKITINPLSIFALILFVMIAQGLFVGIVNNNTPFVILNDTIPILMMALNILRMQSLEEIKKPIDIRFLLISCIIITSLNIIFTSVQGEASIGNASIFYALAFASLFLLRPFPKWLLPIIIIIFLVASTGLNRTSILFIALVMSGYIGYTALIKPTKAFLTVLCVIITAVSLWSVLPEDSGTYKRIVGLSQIDLSSRTGSIGERQEEQDQVRIALEKKGQTTQWLGLGFGGLYDAQFTHEFKENYGHAHYSWVWFNLRFGKLGYFYLLIFSGMLMYSLIRNVSIGTTASLTVAFLCLISMIYLFTYVNSIWLLSGLTFLYLMPPFDKKNCSKVFTNS